MHLPNNSLLLLILRRGTHLCKRCVHACNKMQGCSFKSPNGSLNKQYLQSNFGSRCCRSARSLTRLPLEVLVCIDYRIRIIVWLYPRLYVHTFSRLRLMSNIMVRRVPQSRKVPVTSLCPSVRMNQRGSVPLDGCP